MSAKKPKIQCKCQWCGKDFEIPPSQAKKGRGKYCSRQCNGAAGVDRLNATRKPTEYNPSWFTTERSAGQNNAKWIEPVNLTCKNCGKAFTLKPWILRQPGSKGDFCSIECRGEFRTKYLSGENSPHWVGGPKTYRGRGWRSARLLAVKRDGGACQKCGKVIGRSIPVHHIKPFRHFLIPEAANALDNLVCLCPSCHMHKEYESSLDGGK